MKEIVTITVIWGVVPLMLLSMIYLAHSMIYRAAEGEHRLSIKAGHWAGVIAFFGYAIYAYDAAKLKGIASATAVHFNILYFIAAVTIGYFLVYLIKTLIPTRLGGLVVLAFVFVGSSSLFNYFFIRHVNHIIFSATLGAVFGFFLHAIINPRSIYEIFPETHADPFSDGEYITDEEEYAEEEYQHEEEQIYAEPEAEYSQNEQPAMASSHPADQPAVLEESPVIEAAPVVRQESAAVQGEDTINENGNGQSDGPALLDEQFLLQHLGLTEPVASSSNGNGNGAGHSEKPVQANGAKTNGVKANKVVSEEPDKAGVAVSASDATSPQASAAGATPPRYRKKKRFGSK